MTDYYEECFQKGLEYQDFVLDQLRRMDGMPMFLGAYGSKKYQYAKGESPSGLEIKFDDKLKETNNLFIEVKEKTDATNENFVPSGIMRNDNSWLYLIGDYEQAFIFSRKVLRAACYEGNSHIELKPARQGTAWGYVFPIKYVLNHPFLLAKHIVFNGSDKN